MNIAIFDLDKTLISADSGDVFSNYLCQQGLIKDLARYKEQINIFAQEYINGKLDFLHYYHFAISSLPQMKVSKLKQLAAKFVQDEIRLLLYPQTEFILNQHRKKFDVLLLISATIDLLVLPIGELLGFERQNILAVQMAHKGGYYTGNIIGEPSYGMGKVIRFRQWCEMYGFDPSSCKVYFYSDSINDLPLLERVDCPFVTNPDQKLLDVARLKKWSIIDMNEKLLIDYL